MCKRINVKYSEPYTSFCQVAPYGNLNGREAVIGELVCARNNRQHVDTC